MRYYRDCYTNPNVDSIWVFHVGKHIYARGQEEGGWWWDMYVMERAYPIMYSDVMVM